MANKDFIENIFQRATEEFDIEFNPVAWERMEKKLDRARRRRVLFYWIRLGGLVLFGALTIWLIWRQLTNNQSKPSIKKSDMPVAESPIDSNEYCPETPAVLNEYHPTQETAQAVTKADLSKEADKQSHLTFLRRKNQTASKEPPASDLVLQENYSNTYIQAPDSLGNNSKKLFPEITPFYTPVLTGIAVAPLKSNSEKITQISVNEAFTQSAPVIPTSRLPQPHWTLGILVAPESVSVGFNDQPDFGYNYGLLVEYRFARRFSLHAQGVYAHKRYTAGKGEFQSPRGYWKYGIAPIETTGACSMLTATISLRTQLWQKQRWHIVANTGISSWWMLNEKYNYQYEEHAPGLVYNWQSNKPLTHWWAMAQLGIGAERQISQRLSIQGDIYIQVPLQGVGSGKVQLYTQGVALSLRRRF